MPAKVARREHHSSSGFVVKLDGFTEPLLVEGMWKTGRLRLLDVDIPLAEVRILPAPVFEGTMRYWAISPIVVPVQQENRLHFCHPLESRFYDSLGLP